MADAVSDVDELVDVAEVVDDAEDEVEDEEALDFLFVLFFACFLSLSVDVAVSLHSRFLLFPPEEVAALSSDDIDALDASISLISCKIVTAKNDLKITTIPSKRQCGRGVPCWRHLIGQQ